MSYGNFAEWMDFAYWWSFSGGGSAINAATLFSFFVKVKKSLKKYTCQIFLCSTKINII